MEIFKITRETGIPLVGCIAFGVIDRGTNLLQIRPTSLCNLNCVFCSVDSGPYSKLHPVAFQVELSYLMQWLEEIVNFKGSGVEANLDSVGELLTYPDFMELVKRISELENVSRISFQTNGVLLTKEMVDRLEKLGINQINLSINSLDEKKAKTYSGTPNYNLKHILELAEYVSKSKIQLLLAPVYMPGINDEDIENIIQLAKKLDVRLGIQKYDIYKYGRKYKPVNKTNWWKFYNQLEKWEKEYGVTLKLTAEGMKIEKRERLPKIFEKGEKIVAEIKSPGWMPSQRIGVAKNRSISINDCDNQIGDKVKIK
ncbi:MAG: radical SAM protein, partial [Nanoarchaeota archaeon]|nr:radical SAM protein [Nanoarchaeota archaeon]